MKERNLDFTLDYEVINELGLTLFEEAKQMRGTDKATERAGLLRDAAAQFDKTLAIDSENVLAHYNLQLIHGLLGDQKKADEHAALHARFKPDDNARDRAMSLARRKYPAANFAAEALVIYPLNRPEAPRLTISPKAGPNLVQTEEAFEHAQQTDQ